jgi:hypothetical protein
MRIRTFHIIFILVTSFSFGQSVNSPVSKSIKANFTTASVKAYQESATLKVEDFYNYLTLLSDENTSGPLRTEIKASIYSLFETESVHIIDFTTDEKPFIHLNKFIDKIQYKNYTFLVSDFESSIVSSDYWTTQYKLTVIRNNEKSKSHYFQNVKFKPVLKSFGSTKKEVWTLLLGEIEQ